ncbi:3-methyl-2-oxobutanoate hydroxymethyltransferase [Allomesorhizobium camelthorni]|uniref:3-methyl-2-oxobutanoate hydroxymethyltransferase n=1 Tax=Allomesorhizobium camelthorni TaxID=475069 RepID=A0A6G4WGG3_9HYPH|nr:3-methyl-2-oxobutanoate hydroxymethyltransferase [Mesorhizobium camelthorni]NGO53882.1 ketopantoate hydroxymethyltransferase [Mesorhizobium camelthorni]
MRNIFTFGHRPAQRNWNVADLRANKGKLQLTEVTAMNGEQAARAAAAGIDTIITRSQMLKEVREAAPKTFVTAALMLIDHPTENDVLTGAMRALDEGADALYTTRSLDTIKMLADLDFPVMGHVGLLPPYSTWIGGLRAYGTTADEAMGLVDRFRAMEEAGAFAVEVELVPQQVLESINKQTSLITFSIGSGSGGDVTFLFSEDICGETNNPPRHAHAYGNVLRLQERIERERVEALSAFQSAVRNGSFPYKEVTISMKPHELEAFQARLGETAPLGARKG